MPAEIELHIERLELHGIAGGQQHLFAEGLTRELERLLEQRVNAKLARDEDIARFDAGTVDVGAGGPDVVGVRVASAIYGVLIPWP